MRFIAACLLAASLLLAAPCRAERYAYGGTGEDRLTQAVSLRDGLFAVGTTSSADGDLAARRRTGETGWALRIGADGRRRWDFCSGKSGMLIMRAPHAYADGTLSLVLTDEDGQRGEWIELSARGRQSARTALPAAPCAQGEPARVIAMTAFEGEAGRRLALLMKHEGGGALCCTALAPDGSCAGCGEFYGDPQGVLLADDRRGQAVHLGAELGALAVTRLSANAAPRTDTYTLPDDGLGIARVCGALLAADGSLTACGQTAATGQRGGGFLLRVNAEGEMLFALTLHSPPTHLTETDTGYAVYADGELLFFDEDGAPLGETPVGEEPLCLTGLCGQAALLTHGTQRRDRQAVLLTVPTPEREEPVQVEAESHGSGRIALGEETLVCSGSGAGGVTVSLVDGQGNVRWTTRTPIHTAADRLIWEHAVCTQEGDIRLYGHYETDGALGTTREGASALLGADGVLRELRVEE